MNLHKEIKASVGVQGIDFLGVADLRCVQDTIVNQGGDQLARFTHAVSIGKTLTHAIVDSLSDTPDTRISELYRYYCYDLVNDLLDQTSLRISYIIQAHGFTALPIPAAPLAVSHDRLCGMFSSKLAAHLAGLGWIGKSSLLITPEAGPRVRWATVLTDAPIEPTGQPMASRCGECEECVNACPASAIVGRLFLPEEGRDARFRADACNQHLKAMKEKVSQRVCGICVKVCPHGTERRLDP